MLSLLRGIVPRGLPYRCRALKRSLTVSSPPTSTSTDQRHQHQRNDLHQLLAKVINVTGPLPLSQFMRQCLTHPKLGYYTSRDPLGASGDFITSPEVSQMFGEMLGVWFFSCWLAQGTPRKVNFVEFGPGRGTLMFDVFTSFHKLLARRAYGGIELNAVMIEASHVLRQKQASMLGGSDVDAAEFWHAKHRWGGDITWVDTERDVYSVTNKEDTNFVIAHEFFDALPINKFKNTTDGWREILVDEHPDKEKFCLVEAPKETALCAIMKSQERYNSVPVDTVVEISPESYTYAKVIGDLIIQNGKSTGAALIVDYGPSEGVPGNTLRGIKDHRFVSPFADPGEVDLSVDVDFGAIATAFKDLDVVILGPVEQGAFLENMGMGIRRDQLTRRANHEEQQMIRLAYDRLVNRAEMGGIYKFMGVIPRGVDGIPGFL